MGIGYEKSPQPPPLSTSSITTTTKMVAKRPRGKGYKYYTGIVDKLFYEGMVSCIM